MRVLEVLRVCQCRDQFLVQLEQIVRVEEKLGVTLLHVCEQLGEPASIVLAHGLSDVRHVLIDFLSRLKAELVALATRVKNIFIF